MRTTIRKQMNEKKYGSNLPSTSKLLSYARLMSGKFKKTKFDKYSGLRFQIFRVVYIDWYGSNAETILSICGNWRFRHQKHLLTSIYCGHKDGNFHLNSNNGIGAYQKVWSSNIQMNCLMAKSQVLAMTNSTVDTALWGWWIFTQTIFQ